MEENEYIIVNYWGRFDLQCAFGEMLGLIWSKYDTEHHYFGKSYLGPQTAVKIRLDKNDQPKVGEQPVSPTDELALHYDIAYWDDEKQDPEIALQMKYEADKKNDKTIRLSTNYRKNW